MSPKKIKVGIFQTYIPHYRLGMLRKLQTTEDIEFTVCSPEDAPGRFLKAKHENKEFPFIRNRYWEIKVPFTKNHIGFQPYLIWCVLRRKFDVYIVPCDFLRPCIWLSLILTRFLGGKVCLWGHGISRPPSELSWFLRGMLLRLADAGIFYSEGVRDMWIKRELPKQKLFVAYNALDTDMSENIRANITEQDLVDFRRENLLENKKIILFCGRLFKNWKKPHILVEAMKQVVRKVPDAKAVIIGDGPARQEIEELVKQLDVGEYVDILGPVYDEEILAKYFLSSKAMVIPAAAGLSIQHAFGYGLPVIVGDNKLFSHGPEIELVSEGVTGLFCRDEDIDDFAQKIQLVISDEKLHDRLSKAAYQVIKEKYNVDNMAKGIIDAARYSMSV